MGYRFMLISTTVMDINTFSSICRVRGYVGKSNLTKKLDVHTMVLTTHCANADWRIREVYWVASALGSTTFKPTELVKKKNMEWFEDSSAEEA